ncbi:Protein shisa-5 [Chelonia mydas]|uniref:Protein shisa-5 n=1 Tax=Chelonia mydas TaxID=8469 RepID=M7BVA8_CHEMY|nr:Protein shisa-5 [Chelonia mydas]
MVPASGCSFLALSVLLLQAGALGEYCREYTDSDGRTYSEKSCPQFCCGNCISRYCCLDRSYKFGEDEQFMCNVLDDRTYQPVKEETLKLRSHFDDDWGPGPRIENTDKTGNTFQTGNKALTILGLTYLPSVILLLPSGYAVSQYKHLRQSECLVPHPFMGLNLSPNFAQSSRLFIIGQNATLVI